MVKMKATEQGFDLKSRPPTSQIPEVSPPPDCLYHKSCVLPYPLQYGQ